jgi:hypothetical protein
MNAIFLGIIGEYLGRIFIQTKQQEPLAIIEKEIPSQLFDSGSEK